MRRDGPELPRGRAQPEKEELVPPWPATPGELALCILLFILFLALSWGGLVLWDEVFINTSDTAADTVHAVLHRRGPDGGLLRVPGSDGALYRESHRHHGEILRQTPAPVPALRQRPQKHGEDLDSLEIHVACHGGRNNRLDDQLAETGFPDIDDPVMGPPVRVGRGGGRGPEHPGSPAKASALPSFAE